jgi:hypothetical protein
MTAVGRRKLMWGNEECHGQELVVEKEYGGGPTEGDEQTW